MVQNKYVEVKSKLKGLFDSGDLPKFATFSFASDDEYRMAYKAIKDFTMENEGGYAIPVLGKLIDGKREMTIKVSYASYIGNKLDKIV